MSNLLSSNAKRLFNYSKKISGKGSKYAYSFLNHGNNSSHPTFCLKISNRRCDDAKQFFTFITYDNPLFNAYNRIYCSQFLWELLYYGLQRQCNKKNEQLILYDKLQKAPSTIIDFKIGDILARLTSDLQEISNFFDNDKTFYNNKYYSVYSCFFYFIHLQLATHAVNLRHNSNIFLDLQHFKTQLMKKFKGRKKRIQ